MKFALITGGSRGIGRAVCIRLAEAGYNIVFTFKSNLEEALKTAAYIEEKGVKAVMLKFNVGDKSEVESVLSKWMEENPSYIIEILVNNAGSRNDALMIWMEDHQWSEVLNSSLNGFYYVTKTVLMSMLSKKFGRIINVVSLSGLKGMPGQVNYSAAKAGVIGATKALAQEVARRGVTVNAVAPGFIRSDMTKDLNEKELSKMIPMQRFGEVKEVADAIAFLASPAASYITGEVLSINGGLYS